MQAACFDVIEHVTQTIYSKLEFNEFQYLTIPVLPYQDDIYTNAMFPDSRQGHILKITMNWAAVRFSVILDGFKFVLEWLQAHAPGVPVCFALHDVWATMQQELIDFITMHLNDARKEQKSLLEEPVSRHCSERLTDEH